MDVVNGISALIRVEDDAVNRCQGVTFFGQCRFGSVKGLNFCQMHAHWQARAIVKREAHNFKVQNAKHQQRLNHYVTSQAIKSLKEELGIVRFILERIISLTEDLELQAPTIQRLVRTANRLALTNAKVENSLTSILDTESATGLSRQLLESVAPLITVELYELIYDDVMALIERLVNKDRSLVTTKNYNNLKFTQELQEYLTDDKVFSLRTEISILRLLVETSLNNCTDHITLMAKADRIAGLISDIGETVAACDKLETSMGLLLNKEAAIAFGQELLTIITKHVKSTDILTHVANAMLAGEKSKQDALDDDTLSQLVLEPEADDA